MNWELFTAFVLISAVLIVAPGPIVTLVIATGASRGVRAALTTVAGTALGNGLLIALIAAGLSWVLQNSALLFELLRWAGAAYLIWLGIQAWRSGYDDGDVPPTPRRVHFARGFWVALFNPKTIAFFTAFLPQFVDPALPPVFQLVVMSAVFVVMAAVMDSGWGVAAGLGRAWLTAPSRTRLLARLSGSVLIGGGIWLALARRA
jgi:homoserine/homoserine lactone efflux protein